MEAGIRKVEGDRIRPLISKKVEHQRRLRGSQVAAVCLMRRGDNSRHLHSSSKERFYQLRDVCFITF